MNGTDYFNTKAKEDEDGNDEFAITDIEIGTVEIESEQDEVLSEDRPFDGSLSLVAFDKKRSAEDLAITVWEMISSDHETNTIQESINIISGVISNTSRNKNEALLLFYCFIKEMATFDKIGKFSTEIIEGGIFKRIYASYSTTIQESYHGIVPMVINSNAYIINSNAYIIDAFINGYYPMYVNGIIGERHNLINELLFPDEFLNILFRAIRNNHSKDKQALQSVTAYHSRMPNLDITVINKTYELNIKAINDQFANERALINRSIANGEREKLQNLIFDKLQHLHTPRNPSNRDTQSGNIDSIFQILKAESEIIARQISREIGVLESAEDGRHKQLIRKLDEILLREGNGSNEEFVSAEGKDEHLSEALDRAKTDIISAVIEHIRAVRHENEDHTQVQGDATSGRSSVVLEDIAKTLYALTDRIFSMENTLESISDSRAVKFSIPDDGAYRVPELEPAPETTECDKRGATADEIKNLLMDFSDSIVSRLIENAKHIDSIKDDLSNLKDDVKILNEKVTGFRAAFDDEVAAADELISKQK